MSKEDKCYCGKKWSKCKKEDCKKYCKKEGLEKPKKKKKKGLGI